MNATSPVCANVVTPINAISNMIIGNMWNFRLFIKSSNISLIVPNLLNALSFTLVY